MCFTAAVPLMSLERHSRGSGRALRDGSRATLSSKGRRGGGGDSAGGSKGGHQEGGWMERWCVVEEEEEEEDEDTRSVTSVGAEAMQCPLELVN